MMNLDEALDGVKLIAIDTLLRTICNRPISRMRSADCILEAPGGFEPPVKALQASALPLGHGAISFYLNK